MAGMFDTSVNTKVRRATPTLLGHYTTQEAAAKLDVDPSTLRYRRDTADAKSLWEMLGVTPNDAVNDALARSHVIHNGHHYYERKQFDKFVKLYLQRPEVIRARKQRLRFPKTRQEILSHTVTSEADIQLLTTHMRALLKVDGAVHCILTTN